MRRVVIVRGRVQRVNYRAACAARAIELGLSGSVENLPDGSVEAHFEGYPPAVEAMVAWCAIGPPAARVDSLEQHEEALLGEDGFAVT